MVGHTALQRSISSILSLCELSVWTLYQDPRHLFWIPWWWPINQSIHHACLVTVWRGSAYVPSHNPFFYYVLPLLLPTLIFLGLANPSKLSPTHRLLPSLGSVPNLHSSESRVTQSRDLLFPFLILPPPYSEPCTAQTVGDTGFKDRNR